MKEYFSKRVTYFSRGKGHEHFKEEDTSKVCYPSFCFTWAKVACGVAYEISPKAHHNSKKKDAETENYGEKTIT